MFHRRHDERMLEKYQEACPGPKLSDVEVITLEITGESLGMNCDKTIHRYFRDSGGTYFQTLELEPPFCDRRPILGESNRKFREFYSPVFCRMATKSTLLIGFRCRFVASGELIFPNYSRVRQLMDIVPQKR